MISNVSALGIGLDNEQIEINDFFIWLNRLLVALLTMKLKIFHLHYDYSQQIGYKIYVS